MKRCPEWAVVVAGFALLMATSPSPPMEVIFTETLPFPFTQMAGESSQQTHRSVRVEMSSSEEENWSGRFCIAQIDFVLHQFESAPTRLYFGLGQESFEDNLPAGVVELTVEEDEPISEEEDTGGGSDTGESADTGSAEDTGLDSDQGNTLEIQTVEDGLFFVDIPADWGPRRIAGSVSKEVDCQKEVFVFTYATSPGCLDFVLDWGFSYEAFWGYSDPGTSIIGCDGTPTPHWEIELEDPQNRSPSHF